MLNERQATAFHYDAQNDLARLVVETVRGEVRTESTAGTLLLDRSGFVVGVDVGEGMRRLVVMLGPHEAVTKTVPCAIVLVTDTSSRAENIAEVCVVRAREHCEVTRANPYAPA